MEYVEFEKFLVDLETDNDLFIYREILEFSAKIHENSAKMLEEARGIGKLFGIGGKRTLLSSMMKKKLSKYFLGFFHRQFSDIFFNPLFRYKSFSVFLILFQ